MLKSKAVLRPALHDAGAQTAPTRSWGLNCYGQLGDGTKTDRISPVRIGVENDWAGIGAGGSHSLGLKSNGSLWAWGANWNGQLGDGSLLTQSSPICIGTDTDWAAISAGGNHSLARKTDGTLWSWGANDSGQLGIPADLISHRVGPDTDWGPPP